MSRESPSFFSFQASSITLSNVPEGLNFLLNILHKGFSNVSLSSTPSRPQTSDTPYKAGGAVHVVGCCLFFVQSGYWYLVPAAAAYCYGLLMAMIPLCTTVGGNGHFVARIRVRCKQ